MQDPRVYLMERLPVLGIAGALGALSTVAMAPAPTDDSTGLHQALGEDGSLLVSGLAWEPSRGPVADWLLGRPLLFEAALPNDAGERRDIYRALVRVSPEGKVLDIRSRRNLTGTRRADEYGLGSRGRLAWFGSQGKDNPGSITFLDLEGETNPARGTSLLGRLQLGISRLLETGTWAGLGRSDLFGDGGKLTVKVGEVISVGTSADREELTHADIFSGSEKSREFERFRLVARTREPSAWLHWAADAGRHIVGSGPIAWAEGRAFSLWDNLHQVGYSVTSIGEPKPSTPTPLPASQATARSAWPPERIVTGETSKESDGIWRAVKDPILPQEDPPLFYRTQIHPDPDRPYAQLQLVAMDMRRLKLGIGAGYEDPHPDSGPPGSGQIPEEVAPDVVATFNGAFKAIHGQYGMKAEGRLLVEPVVGAATVRIDKRGSAGFGTWGPEHKAADVASFRQNLDPLVAEGKVNPKQRKVWGDQLYGAGVAVERSALCYHSSGHLVYGWATEATGESLARGMALAGCVYAIHLDMNPGHCAFIFNRIKSVQPLSATGSVLDSRMRVNSTRFVRWSPKDFFYLSARNSLPESETIAWQVAPGEGPMPTSIPAILIGKKSVGDLVLEFDRIDLSRLHFTIAPGSAETNQPGEIPSTEPGSALVAWGLGHRTGGMRTGLTIGTSVLSPLHRNYASLIIEDGKLRLLPPAEPQVESAATQIVQLPALARAGALLPAARELGGKRERSALCIDETDTLLIARMTHDTPAPLAQALIDLGCGLVVQMDRGSHPLPLVERAGTDTPPHTGYEQTMLYGMSAEMKPHTHLF